MSSLAFDTVDLLRHPVRFLEAACSIRVIAIVVAEEINHLDGRVRCQEQRATEMNARAPWQGYGRVGEEGSMGVAARGQAPASGT